MKEETIDVCKYRKYRPGHSSGPRLGVDRLCNSAWIPPDRLELGRLDRGGAARDCHLRNVPGLQSARIFHLPGQRAPALTEGGISPAGNPCRTRTRRSRRAADWHIAAPCPRTSRRPEPCPSARGRVG